MTLYRVVSDGALIAEFDREEDALAYIAVLLDAEMTAPGTVRVERIEMEEQENIKPFSVRIGDIVGVEGALNLEALRVVGRVILLGATLAFELGLTYNAADVLKNLLGLFSKR
jgi:hypothetical protein